LSGTKYVAKIASGHRKPDGLTVVPPTEAREWLAPLPVSSLWGVGPKTEARLRALGLSTIGDVAACRSDHLARLLGKLGKHLHRLALAEDDRRVVQDRVARSIGSERTLNIDIESRPDIEHHLRTAAENVASRLRRHRIVARGVRVKLKRADFQLLTRQRRLPAGTDVAAELFAAAADLTRHIGDRGPFRLVGLAAYDLIDVCANAQLGLPLEAGSRARRLETTLDRLAARYGAGIVHRGGELLHDRGVGIAANLDFLAAEDLDSERGQ
jgi:DNA polymerase-4